jgi:vacuolar iron transporter family protein
MGRQPDPDPDDVHPESTGKEDAPQAGRPEMRFEEKHAHIRGRGLISSSALGIADGLVTNLAFLSGFAGAVSGIELIRFAGLAAMLAGAVSMFFGGVLAARSEVDLFEADSRREAYEIKHERDEEMWELKNLYKGKGLTDDEAEMIVTKISSDDDKFLEDMLVNELHLHRSNLQNPYKLGGVVGLSFVIGALVPLLPYYAFSLRTYSLTASVALSLAFLFAVGAWKGRVVGKRPWMTGLEALLLGAIAAGLLFLIGTAFVFV